LESFPTTDELADAERINQVFEEGIRLAPEQYLWTLQWFRTQPDGDPSPYS
jgi:lauroyl/myristoyl acyltransferase